MGGNLKRFMISVKNYVEEFQPHRRDVTSRIERKIRDRINSKADDLMPTRKARRRRFRRHAMACVKVKPRKILGSRFRSR